ncbi:carboxymuconolactone decarboxylase family protein [Pseudomonas oryzihabitans]|uniref:carboxymuconolactone decarboxylase family protein n=2 Tax=Pseudomonas oryzihabitans TaxID=47885 RepID=UPI003703B8B8
MSNIRTSLLFTALFICAPGLAVSSERPLAAAQETFPMSTTVSPHLSVPQQALLPIAALAAMGDLPRLAPALERGLDAGLTVSEIREILVQLYAYAGFPRSLNALGQLMKVLETRRQRGVVDELGKAPSQPIPRGEALLQAGTVNQTRLSGAPVTGALFEFAPAIDEYLKTHLFGDIFSRDNLDWTSRELATVSMLAAISGTDPQLQAHLKISRNVGLTTNQLQQLATILGDQVDMQTGSRVKTALAALPAL